jgi:hypothetical protein
MPLHISLSCPSVAPTLRRFLDSRWRGGPGKFFREYFSEVGKLYSGVLFFSAKRNLYLYSTYYYFLYFFYSKIRSTSLFLELGKSKWYYYRNDNGPFFVPRGRAEVYPRTSGKKGICTRQNQGYLGATQGARRVRRGAAEGPLSLCCGLLRGGRNISVGSRRAAREVDLSV